MAAAAIVPFVTVDEYLHTSYRPDVDYIDGQIEERNLGEFDHGDLQTILGTIFRNHQKDWGLKAVTDVRVQISSTRFRVPDLSVIDAAKPRTRIIREAPALCIEVLSPEERWTHIQVRLDEYLAMGVPEVWVFDPETRTASILRLGAATTKCTEGILRLPNTAVELNLAEVFAVLDEGR